MKTLILSDETWSEIERVLKGSERGRKVLGGFDRTAHSQMPDDRELIRLARTKADAPEAFTRARDARDAGRQAAEDTRLVLNDLIRHAYHVGVGPSILSRWAGLKPARIHEIIGPSS